jgi:1,4-dihydroxy-2-naphthoyl-CoA hydrolase
MDLQSIVQHYDMPFTQHLGIRFLSVAPERLTAEMVARDDLCNRSGILHGGAIMAFADTLGACATSLNLPDGAGTTTVESKTNFLAPAPAGSKVIGECLAFHRGRRTMVWQTRVTSEDGRLVAVVTQTQLVLERPRGVPFQLAPIFAGKSTTEQKGLLATIERDCAALYRQLAAIEPDVAVRDALLTTAARHDESASLLKA